MYLYKTTVEFEDIDSYGIIHHPKVLHYFERTRVHFFNDNNLKIDQLKHGIVLRNVNIQYKKPLTLLDKIDIELRVKKLENYSFEWDYRIIKDNKLCVAATIEMATIDLDTKKLIPVPDYLKELLETILVKE